MEDKKYIIEVEPALEAKDGRPSMGPVYRSMFAKEGFASPIDGLDSCWDIFRCVAFFFRFACFLFLLLDYVFVRKCSWF